MKKFVLFCLLVTVTFGYADDSKISPELRGYNSTQPVQVIVQYAPGTQPPAQANCGGLLGLVNCVVSDLLNIVGQLPLINGVVALVDGTGIVNLSNQSNVVYISSDRQLSTLDVAGPAVNAEVAWQSNYIGTGIGVALIDSGVNSHPDLYTGILPISRVVVQPILHLRDVEHERPVRPRNPYRGLDCRRRTRFNRTCILANIQGNRARRRDRQSARAGCERRGH